MRQERADGVADLRSGSGRDPARGEIGGNGCGDLHGGIRELEMVEQNMHAKGLVHRNQDGQAHVYEAREPARMKRQLLGELVQRVFAGSASQLVLHLLEDEKATQEEIEEIRQMLAEHKRRRK